MDTKNEGWRSDWPDWRDSGPVEVVLEDGRTAAGSLEADDFIISADGDEAPIWTLRLPDGSRLTGLDFGRWRKVKKPEAKPAHTPPPASPVAPRLPQHMTGWALVAQLSEYLMCRASGEDRMTEQEDAAWDTEREEALTAIKSGDYQRMSRILARARFGWPKKT